MIIVRKPSGDVVAEKIIEINNPELEKQLLQAKAEIERLKTASNTVKTQIRHITVEKIVDSPELLAKVKNLTDQVVALEAARLTLQKALHDNQTRVIKVDPVEVKEKIVEVEKVIYTNKASYIILAFAIGCALTFIAQKIIS